MKQKKKERGEEEGRKGRMKKKLGGREEQKGREKERKKKGKEGKWQLEGEKTLGISWLSCFFFYGKS